MRNKIRECINTSYTSDGKFNRNLSVELLEALFDREIMSFNMFLRQNYLTRYIDDNDELPNNIFREYETGEQKQLIEIYKSWRNQ